MRVGFLDRGPPAAPLRTGHSFGKPQLSFADTETTGGRITAYLDKVSLNPRLSAPVPVTTWALWNGLGPCVPCHGFEDALRLYGDSGVGMLAIRLIYRLERFCVAYANLSGATGMVKVLVTHELPAAARAVIGVFGGHR